MLRVLLPAAMALLLLGSALVRRPLTGVLFNAVAGGPRGWRQHTRLVHVYTLTTLAGAALMAVNAVYVAVAFAADRPELLAVLLIVTWPVMSVLFVVTLVAARRVVSAPG